MPKKTFISIGIGIVLFIAGIFLAEQHRSTRLCHNLSCIRIDDSTQFTLKELYADTGDQYRALYASDRAYIRIETTTTPPESSSELLTRQITTMKGMFEKAPAPYPGDISDAVVCDQAFVPKYSEFTSDGNTIRLFTGFLNNRMTFGSCSQSEATYKGFVAFLYCNRSQMLTRFELFAETKEFDQHAQTFERQIRSLSCKE